MRLHSLSSKHSRAGLTLVEMLIALALSIFIMAIMSEAFVKGIEAFGNFKALADLEQRLRTVANIIRRDLKAPHFDTSKKLSECTVSGRAMPVLDGLQANVYTANQAKALLRQLAPYQLKTPAEGFFSIEESPNSGAGATMFYEGTDASGRPSYRDIPVVDSVTGAITRNSDVLHFTSRLEGNDPDKFFIGTIRSDVVGNPSPLNNKGTSGGATRYTNPGNNVYTNQAAELLYFLGVDGSQFIPGVTTPGGPVLTFNLYRQAYLLVPDQFSNGDQVAGDTFYGANADAFFNGAVVAGTTILGNDVSAVPSGTAMIFNSMANVQHRARRRGARSPKHLPTSLTDADGSDILLTNVISFDVKVFDPFAYKLPLDINDVNNPLKGPPSGRGAYVDIGDVLAGAVNPRPTAASSTATAFPAFGDDFLIPVFGAPINTTGVTGRFDTGTNRFDGNPNATVAPFFTPAESPRTHTFPFTSIQITIRVYEPKSKQTRQITIIQDM